MIIQDYSLVKQGQTRSYKKYLPGPGGYDVWWSDWYVGVWFSWFGVENNDTGVCKFLRTLSK